MKTIFIIAVGVMVATLIGCASTPEETAANTMSTLPAQSSMSQVPAVAMGGAASAPVASVGMAGSTAMGMSPAANQMPALAQLLVQRLGITPAQATGGAGSIFSMAQRSMSPSNFGLVSKAVPGMEQLLAAAPSSGAAGLVRGGGGLGQMAALANSFQSLGMGSGMMNQFIPIVLQYLQGQGGFSTMGLLQSVLFP